MYLALTGTTDIAKIAIKVGSMDALRWYIKHGKIDVQDTFMYVCKLGKLDSIRLLLDNGANINYKRGKALVDATMDQNVEVMEFLLANGADIRDMDKMHISIHLAGIYGYLAYTKYLLAKETYPADKLNEALLSAVFMAIWR